MTRDEALEKLWALDEMEPYRPQEAHERADEILLQLIDDADISEAFQRLEKWYA